MLITEKQPLLEAHLWYKNGDIPGEVTERFTDGQYKGELYEGSVVRYYRNPSQSGTSVCPRCGNIYHVHGWIHQDEDGLTVCPGSYVIKDNDRYTVLDEAAFKEKYIIVSSAKGVSHER